jgi:hypothetical protein
VWNWGVRPGGPEAGSGRRLQGGHPDLAGWRLRRRRRDDRARAGAVRRAACAEPICGAEGWLAMMLHRRWSEYGGAARRLHRAGHGGSQERGAFASASLGGSSPSTTRPELARAGGRVAVLPTTGTPERGGVCVSRSGGRLPSPPRPKLERAAGGSPSLGARERWLPASGFSPENWLSASGFWLENWLSGAGFPLEKGLPGFHARLDGRVAVPAELARVVVVPHAMGQL